MLVSLAAAAALCAGCGGGSADTERTAPQGAAALPVVALSPDAGTSAHASVDASVDASADRTPDASAAPLVADTGPIQPWLMDDETQAGLALGQAFPAPHAMADDPAKAEPDEADDAATAKALLDQAATDADPADASAGPMPVALPASNAAAAPALPATRSGGRTVPQPATSVATGGVTTPAAPQEAVAVRPIRTGDIRLQVEAARSFNTYKWLWGMECGGQKQGAVNIPETGLKGFDLGNGLGVMRFGKVADPDNASRKVLMFRPNAGDPLVAGAPRCEMTFSPSFGGKLPVNQHVWFAFGIRLQDWVNTTDEQILMQWHWSNGSIPIGPFLALSLKGGKLHIDSKSNNRYPPSAATTTSRVHWSNGAVANNTWTYFVVKARISPNPANSPYLKVWRDGTQVVNYSGPLGYNYPQVTPYVKIGHYQWNGSANYWSAAARTKTILVRTPALIDDPAGLYKEVDIREHVKNR